MLKKSYTKLLTAGLNPATQLRLHYALTWGEKNEIVAKEIQHSLDGMAE